MKKILLIILAACSILPAQEEFLVNTYTDTTQRAPVIACDPQGNYVVAWQSVNQYNENSKTDVYYQFFSSEDGKVLDAGLLNSITDSEQELPAIAMAHTGEFIAVWVSKNGEESLFDIKAAVIRSPVMSIPPLDEFMVNTTTVHSQTKPDVAVDPDRNFVIVWESWYQDGSNKGVYARMFDILGNPLTGEIPVNTTTQYSQGRPKVKFLNNGNFVVIWESWKQDIATPSGYGLYGKIFDSQGNVVKDEFRINSYTNDYQWFGDLAALSDGGFATVWCSWKQDGEDGGIYIRKYDADGNEVSDEVLVNKTTVKYQWLPRVNEMPDGKIGVVWSSWQQDGSREGVYAKLLNSDLSAATFETQVNDYTDSYQWEPDFVPSGIDEMVVTWSSWGQYDNDYEVMAKRIKLTGPQAVIGTKTYEHPGGNTTARFYVHVMDSTQLTGNEYELSFPSVAGEIAVAQIKNTTTDEIIVSNYSLNKGEGIFYLTPEFDGVAVEIQPNFTFDLDRDRSYFVNNSGTNINYTIGQGFGSAKLAPIDIALIWGSTDTLSDGNYAAPLDTAYNSTGTKLVECPFYVWNMTDGEKMDLVVLESSTSANLRWDYSENVGFLTPAKYEPNFPQYHASLNFTVPSENAVLPSAGDTNFVFTKRPLTVEDKFIFKTDRTYITTGVNSSSLTPNEFKLYQNYPNPFNPTTTIEYQIPYDVENGKFASTTRIKLVVYDILGREVATLVDKQQKPGTYKVLFDASNLASGVYFYKLKVGNYSANKKMLFVK